MNAHIRQTDRKNSSHFIIWIALILLIMVNFSINTNMINFSFSPSTIQTALRYSRSDSPILKVVPVPSSSSVAPLPGATPQPSQKAQLLPNAMPVPTPSLNEVH